MDMDRVLDLLVSPASSIAVIYFYDRFIAAKRNGMPVQQIVASIVPEVTSGVNKEVLQALDMANTLRFEQLRRDLSMTIEKATENSIMRYMWEAEKRWEAERGKGRR